MGDGEEVIERNRRRMVTGAYTADKLGIFQRIYHAEFWVATYPDVADS
jgi:hypothetical protein